MPKNCLGRKLFRTTSTVKISLCFFFLLFANNLATIELSGEEGTKMVILLEWNRRCCCRSNYVIRLLHFSAAGAAFFPTIPFVIWVHVCSIRFKFVYSTFSHSLSFSLPFNNNENNDEGAKGLCNAELHPKWVIRSSFFLACFFFCFSIFFFREEEKFIRIIFFIRIVFRFSLFLNILLHWHTF